MSLDIEELRKQKERLDREREEVERRLSEAERHEREQAAAHLVDELRAMTVRIDALKDDRQKLLLKIREAAPRLGDFTYAQDDWKLTLQAARAQMKQPELLSKLLAALEGAGIHAEPRAPRFRLFRGLRPIGTLQVHAKRLSIVAAEPVLDPAILDDVRALAQAYPGLATLELASEKKERRVREGSPVRAPDGDYALAIHFAAADTGSLDAVLPLALRAFEHVASYWERWTPDTEARLFEPWPAEPVAAAPVPVPAPAA